MKFAAVVFVIYLTSFICHAIELENLKSPLESPRYRKVIEKLYPQSSGSGTKPTGRITNGSPASLGQFPHQVFILTHENTGAIYLCGGSIIHQRWILTAAHCLYEMVKIEVHFGAITRYTGQAGSVLKTLTVTRRGSIIVHPDYNDEAISNDIGLIELPADANGPIVNVRIGEIPLPKGTDSSNTFLNYFGTVSGFGRYSDYESYVSATLQYMIQMIVDNSVCARTFGPEFVLPTNICQESVNRVSSCSGDSGGPLSVIGKDNVPIIVGIVSYGAAIGCEQGHPNVFTRVTSYIPWIEQTTGLRFS